MPNFIKDEFFSLLLGGKCARAGACVCQASASTHEMGGKQNTGGSASLAPTHVGPHGPSTQLTFSWNLCAFQPFLRQQPPLQSP